MVRQVGPSSGGNHSNMDTEYQKDLAGANQIGTTLQTLNTAPGLETKLKSILQNFFCQPYYYMNTALATFKNNGGYQLPVIPNPIDGLSEVFSCIQTSLKGAPTTTSLLNALSDLNTFMGKLGEDKNSVCQDLSTEFCTSFIKSIFAQSSPPVTMKTGTSVAEGVAVADWLKSVANNKDTSDCFNSKSVVFEQIFSNWIQR